MKAFGKYILAKPIKREEQTKGGIFLVTDEGGAFIEGRAIAESVGEAVTSIKRGDLIQFKAHHEHEVEVDGEKMWFITVDSVLGFENPKND